MVQELISAARHHMFIASERDGSEYDWNAGVAIGLLIAARALVGDKELLSMMRRSGIANASGWADTAQRYAN
jgi:hypothetical protein